eukprot:scaffold67434_cov62-Phaeocystis_antarctica.AAC.2
MHAPGGRASFSGIACVASTASRVPRKVAVGLKGIQQQPSGSLRAIGRTCTSSDVDPPPPSHLWEQRCRLGSSRSAPEPNPLSKSPLVMSRGNIAATPAAAPLPRRSTCGERWR